MICSRSTGSGSRWKIRCWMISFPTEGDRRSNQSIQDRLVSALGGKPENVCSDRALPVLTRSGSLATGCGGERARHPEYRTWRRHIAVPSANCAVQPW
jgi:hypothetical protein